ncbi:ASCH domain-containing protein [Sphingobacterium sp. MYb382]|uniref:ASCH domain-containing protein n=1 Tax=Sphingobacterium sp. MYb382 TaxID=2745278 RepID=UPI00309572DF
MNPIEIYWKSFQAANLAFQDSEMPMHYYYGDNKAVADECAELVRCKIKQATSPSRWWFETHNEVLPKPGDVAIVTNWAGEPKAIVRTTKVEVLPFNAIDADYAAIEGEGDKSLAYWKKEHWHYYSKEMQKYGLKPI